MRFNPLTIIDKTGNEVILRNAKIDDAENMIKYLQITTSETPYLTREPDEVILRASGTDSECRIHC